MINYRIIQYINNIWKSSDKIYVISISGNEPIDFVYDNFIIQRYNLSHEFFKQTMYDKYHGICKVEYPVGTCYFLKEEQAQLFLDEFLIPYEMAYKINEV